MAPEDDKIDDQDTLLADPDEEKGKTPPEEPGKPGDEKPPEEGLWAPGPPKSPEDKKDDDKAKWDKERQQRDQEAATERKTLADKIASLTEDNKTARSEIADLKAMLKDLQVEEEDTEAADQPPEKLDRKFLDSLTENADAEAIVKGIKMLATHSDGRDRLIAELRAKLQEAEEREDRALEEQMALDQICDQLDERFGRGRYYRDAAVKLARQKLLDAGYTRKNLPPLVGEQALELAYRELVDKEAAKKPPDKPKGRIPPDTGRGGVAASGEVQEGTLEEVADQLRRRPVKI